MIDKTADFEDRLVFDAIRIWNKKTKEMCLLQSGYKINVPTASGNLPFLSLEGKSNVKNYLFMMKITHISNVGDIFESDIVDYSVSDLCRSVGVVMYDKEKFRWCVQDTKTPEYAFGFDKCQINKVVGNIYETPKFLSYSLEWIYKSLRISVPDAIAKQVTAAPANNEKKQYATLNEEIPGLSGHEPEKTLIPQIDASVLRTRCKNKEPEDIKEKAPSKNQVDVFIEYKINEDRSGNWLYRLQSPDGVHVQEKSGRFNKIGDEGYYMVASALIALNRLTRPFDSINVHTNSKILNDILNDKLAFWKKYDWKKPDGSDLNHRTLLMELDKVVSKVGGNVHANLLS